MNNKLALAANSSTTIVIPKDIEIGSTQEFHTISCPSASLTYQTIAIAQNINIDRNIKKIFEQYFSVRVKSNNSVKYGNCKSLHNLEQFYENLYGRKNLPKQVRQLEKISRYYCYLWLAWYYYSKQKYSLMTRYLWESWQYTDACSRETINHWYDFLGEDLNQDNNLSAIPEWQQLIEQIRGIEPPKVSVIIPSYNCDRYLPEAIESVFNQTYQDYEIIVINDGSTDRTLEVIAPYLEQIRYVYQENQGAGKARNRGLYLARGELIAFLDADDLFLPHKLKEQVAIFEEREEIGIVNSGFRVIGENGEPIMDVERWQEIPDLTPEVWLLHKPILPSAMMFRRHWFELVGGFRQRFFPCEDMEIVLRMVVKDCQSIWLTNITTCYRRYNLSATALNSARILKLTQSAEAMQDDFFAREDLPASMRQLEGKSRFYYYCWLAWLCYQSSLYDQMSQYLLKSQSYAPHSWVETVSEWLNTFSNCAQIYGCDFDAYSLSNLSQWQGTIVQIQSSALERSYQPQIKQVQQLFHGAIDHQQIALYGQTYYQLARKLIQQHDLEQGIICLRRAIELVPNNAFYHHALGNAYQQQYELDQALFSYQRALGLQPNQHNFQTSLQSVLKQQQQWQKLVDYCQQTIRQPESESRPKLLMIFPFTPDPEQKGGAAIRMFEQIKYFGRRYQLTVVAFIFEESDKQLATQLEQYCDLALLLEVGTPMSPYSQNRHQQLYFLQTWNMWKSLSQLSQIDFDVVFFEFIFTTVYYPLFSDRFTVLNEHNIESKLLQSCAQTNSQELIARLARRVDAVKPFVNAQSEAKFLAAYEERMWSLFPLITLVSSEDQQELEARCPSQGGQTRTLVVKNGVNTQEILPVKNQQGQKILFMGTMSYFPNIDGVLYFVEEILPQIKKQEPSMGLCIAGRQPPEEIWTLEEENAAIEVIADPTEMREVAAQCQMTVVPLRIGGGTRIKILHSMAMGLPVVSTSLGSEGLEVVDGQHLLIRDDPEQFAEAVLELAGDSQLRDKLRRNARHLVEAQYDWQAIFAHFERFLLRFASLSS